jgi:hypothetical protein
MGVSAGVGSLVVELELEKLKEPTFYEVLFGATSIAEQDLLQDAILKVRPLEPAGSAYEIVVGVEQYRAALRQGARAVAAVVKEMTEDEARRYATDEFLRAEASSSARSIVQLLVAAKDNEARGGGWGVERLTKALGIKTSTYAHAWSSVTFVCDRLRRSEPKAAHLGLAELVALAVRRNFLPAFTELYTGRMTVNRFYREVYKASEVGQERSRQQQEAKGKRKLRPDAGARPSAEGIAAYSPANGPAPTPAAVRPGQLIAEAIVKLAQAASVNDGGDDRAGGEQALDEQLVIFLDSHTNLESLIRRICRQLLNHLGSTHGHHRRSKATRPAQPIYLDDARQLSFELAATASQSGGRESERRCDNEASAA